jgi:hypothetical protein
MAYPHLRDRPVYQTCIAVVLHDETDSRLRVSTDGLVANSKWLPKHRKIDAAPIAKVNLISKRSDFVTITLPTWLAAKEGLVVANAVARLDASVWPPVTVITQPLTAAREWTPEDHAAWRDCRLFAEAIRDDLNGKPKARSASDWGNARVFA